MNIFLVSNVTLSGYEQLVSEMGGDASELLGLVELSASDIANPDGYLSYLAYADLLNYTAVKLHDPLFGLRLARRHGPDLLGPLSLSLRLQPSLDAALDYLLSHAYLFAYGQLLTRAVDGEHTHIMINYEFIREHGYNELRQSSSQHLHNYLSTLVVDDIGQLKIHLRQPKPASIDKEFDSVIFDAEFDGVSFPSEWLTCGFNIDNEHILQFVDQYMMALVKEFPHSYSEMVSTVVIRFLKEGDCSMPRVAKTLQCGVRTLQLRLKEEGSSYGKILQKCRQELACNLLKFEQYRVTDVAFELGFSDVSTFSRNFKSWTGISPLQWQKENT